MRILIQACAEWTHVGYSNQARGFAKGFKELGHEVGWFAFWGLQGGMLQTPDWPIYPPAYNTWGADIVKGHKEHFKADIVLTHWDIWVVTEGFAEEAYPWVSYFPFDQCPAPPRVIARAQECYQPVVFSKFALQTMADAGVECAYVPHGIDLDVFKPRDKLESRRALGVPEDCFLIGMVAANKGYPSRKALPETLLAFKEFRRRHEDAVLYLHTIMGTDNGGVDIRAIMESLDLPKGSVTSVDQYHYIIGLPDEYLVDAYNAMSVLHSASLAEGFGLPILESQACGTRVVTTDCSSMTELTFDGIATKPAQRFWTQLNSWAAMPSVENILDAWERIYAGELGDWREHSQKAIAGAQAFAWPIVINEHWGPLLVKLEARLEEDHRLENLHSDFVTLDVPDASAPPEADPLFCPGGTHRWSPTGLVVGDALCVPCLNHGCEAEMRVLKSGQREVRATGFGMTRHGITLDIEDHPLGGVSKIVYRELQESYRLDDIDFEDGDVVLDIGAHVGVVSIYLAKLYPNIEIIAFEPIGENYKRLYRNIDANEAENVNCLCTAVSSDGRDLTLRVAMDKNSGGASALVSGEGKDFTASLTLAEVFERYVPDRCKLLKMDIEGMEHEVLAADNDLLKRVDYLAIEIHESETLRAQGHTAEGLKNLCASYISGDRLRTCVSRLAEGDGPDGDTK